MLIMTQLSLLLQSFILKIFCKMKDDNIKIHWIHVLFIIAHLVAD